MSKKANASFIQKMSYKEDTVQTTLNMPDLSASTLVMVAQAAGEKEGYSATATTVSNGIQTVVLTASLLSASMVLSGKTESTGFMIWVRGNTVKIKVT